MTGTQNLGSVGPPGVRPWNWTLPAVIVALLVVAGTLGFGLGYLDRPGATATPIQTAPPAQPPPFLNVSVLGREGSGAPVPLGNAAVSVFSVDPRSVGLPILTDLQGLAPTSNGYYNEILQGRTGAGGSVAFAAPPAWGAITAAWASTVSPLTSNVSLRVDATYARPTVAGVEVYHATENVPFDPAHSSAALTTELTLDLLHPVSLLPSPAPTGIPCDYTLATSWSDTVFSMSHGQMPLAWLDNNATDSPAAWIFLSDYWGQFQSVTVGFPTVQVYGTTVEASSAPAWEGTIPNFFIAESAVMATQLNASYNGAAVVMDNVSLLTVLQSENLTWAAPGCPAVSQVVPVMTLSVPNALETSDLGLCSDGFCSNNWMLVETLPSSWTHLLATLPNQTMERSTSLAPESAVNWTAMTDNVSGLSAARHAEVAAQGSAFSFPVNLGEALLYMDLPSGCEDSGCTTFCYVCAESGLESQLGFAVPYVRALEPIAVVFDSGPAGGTNAGGSNRVQDVWFNYNPENQNATVPVLQMKLEGAGTPTDLTIDGTTYAYSAPSMGMVACPAGVLLEPWAEC